MAKNKSEIDKEMMYRKIMPTAARPLQASPSYTENKADLPHNTESLVPSTLVSGMPAVTQSVIKKSAASGIKIRESQNMILVNIMEELVISKLDSTLLRFNCCKCNKCKKDIAAIALNRLTPKYIVMKENDAQKRKDVEEKYSSDVTGALVQAILAVKKEPRH